MATVMRWPSILQVYCSSHSNRFPGVKSLKGCHGKDGLLSIGLEQEVEVAERETEVQWKEKLSNGKSYPKGGWGHFSRNE